MVLETLILRDMCLAYDPFKNVSNSVFAFLDLWINTFWLHKMLANTFWLQTNYFKTVTSDFLHGSSFMWHLQFLAKTRTDMPKEPLFSSEKGEPENDSFPKEDKQSVTWQTFTSYISFKIIQVVIKENTVTSLTAIGDVTKLRCAPYCPDDTVPHFSSCWVEIIAWVRGNYLKHIWEMLADCLREVLSESEGAISFLLAKLVHWENLSGSLGASWCICNSSSQRTVLFYFLVYKHMSKWRLSNVYSIQNK